jgi:hypothetical protein
MDDGQWRVSSVRIVGQWGVDSYCSGTVRQCATNSVGSGAVGKWTVDSGLNSGGNGIVGQLAVVRVQWTVLIAGQWGQWAGNIEGSGIVGQLVSSQWR